MKTVGGTAKHIHTRAHPNENMFLIEMASVARAKPRLLPTRPSSSDSPTRLNGKISFACATTRASPHPQTGGLPNAANLSEYT